MIEREKYLNQLLLFKDTGLIKVVTGVRRCGKSSLLALMQERLRQEGVEANRIISFQMESMEFDAIRDYQSLYATVKGRIESIPRPYLFFDELQEVEGWERTINSLRADGDCDIYITGSNAHLLSSELSTLLSGRYVEVEMLPLVFSEYLAFRGIAAPATHDPQAIAEDRDGSPVSLGMLFEQFREYGGFPFLSFSEPSRDEHRLYLKSLYDTVVIRDILERDRRKGARLPRNGRLLERICRFLADNIGNENSPHSIANALRSNSEKASSDTVGAYISSLCDAYLFYPAKRYDIKGKELLKTNGKHYIVDTGLRSFLDGYRNSDPGRTLENIVYLQLLYAGYEVAVGKLRQGEVDFVATRDSERFYIQVCEDMRDEATLDRELRPLRAIGDAYPKLVVTGLGSYPRNIDGIAIRSITEFLLKPSL